MNLGPTPDGRHWVLWDGECGFCRRTILWFRRRDPRGLFRDMPYQEAPSPPMTPELYRACARAVHVIRSDGALLRAGRAMLFMLEMTGWGVAARVLSRPPLIWAVELGYRIIADNRSFFSRFLFR